MQRLKLQRLCNHCGKVIPVVSRTIPNRSIHRKYCNRKCYGSAIKQYDRRLYRMVSRRIARSGYKVSETPKELFNTIYALVKAKDKLKVRTSNF